MCSLNDAGFVGMTVSLVRGMGAQEGTVERYAGSEFLLGDLVSKAKIDITLSKGQVDEAVRTICLSAHTGETGDGKVFVYPVCDMVRIRTGETGNDAEHMAGGYQDRYHAAVEVAEEVRRKSLSGETAEALVLRDKVDKRV